MFKAEPINLKAHFKLLFSILKYPWSSHVVRCAICARHTMFVSRLCKFGTREIKKKNTPFSRTLQANIQRYSILSVPRIEFGSSGHEVETCPEVNKEYSSHFWRLSLINSENFPPFPEIFAALSQLLKNTQRNYRLLYAAKDKFRAPAVVWFCFSFNLFV